MNDVNASEIVAANVRREMKARGWTQQRLADAAEIAQPRIADVLSGKFDYRLSTVERVAKAFGVPTSVLLTPILSAVSENSVA